LSAALAAEAERVYAQLTRGTFNEATPARFDQIRIAIINFGSSQEAEETNECQESSNRIDWGSGVGDSTKFRAYR
jgi:hypothetical protein